MKGAGRPHACTGFLSPASRVSDIEQVQQRNPPPRLTQRTCASRRLSFKARPRSCAA